MGDSLMEGSAQLPTNPRLNGKTILAEREGSNSLSRLNGGCTPSLMGTTPFLRSGHGTYLDWLRKEHEGR